MSTVISSFVAGLATLTGLAVIMLTTPAQAQLASSDLVALVAVIAFSFN